MPRASEPRFRHLWLGQLVATEGIQAKQRASKAETTETMHDMATINQRTGLPFCPPRRRSPPQTFEGICDSASTRIMSAWPTVAAFVGPVEQGTQVVVVVCHFRDGLQVLLQDGCRLEIPSPWPGRRASCHLRLKAKCRTPATPQASARRFVVGLTEACFGPRHSLALVVPHRVGDAVCQGHVVGHVFGLHGSVSSTRTSMDPKRVKLRTHSPYQVDRGFEPTSSGSMP